MDQKRILIVEDDLFLRELYTDVLSAEGYKVDAAADGEEALQKMKVGGYNLVLLDIIMPKMDGLTALKRIRKNEWGKDVCITILTNISDSAKVDEALKDGAFEYLIKADWEVDKIVKKLKTRLGIE